MKSSKSKQQKPLTVTITGELAKEVRTLAKQLSCRPSTITAIYLRTGIVSSAQTPEGREFRLGTAAAYIGLSESATAELHRHAVEREKAAVAQRKAEIAAASREVPRRRKAA